MRFRYLIAWILCILYQVIWFHRLYPGFTMKSNLIYVVDDDYSLRRLMEYTIQSWGYRVRSFPSAESLLKNLDEGPEVILLDHMLPGMSGLETLNAVKRRSPELPVIMLSAQARIDVAVEIMRAGATDYFTKPVDLKRLQFSLNNAIHLHALRDKVRVLQDTLESSVKFDNIVSSSGVMQDVLKLADKARTSDITVLIEGESGTGKELIARAIHFNGPRKTKPFVVINCAAIPRDLLESELFGHERGAFTGAVERKVGKFEVANGGTIFLDEIGEMDHSLQAKLLRVLQLREFERVGGLDTITTDARIVSATNRDLRAMAAEKTFREDLYYRLSTFPIKMPALRERPAEIPLLAEHFLNTFREREGKPTLRFSSEVPAALMRYSWPGNVRELQSVIERATLLAEGDEIQTADLPMSLIASSVKERPELKDTLFSTREMVFPLERVKEIAVRRALELYGGNISEAARALEIGRTTMYDLLKRYNSRK